MDEIEAKFTVDEAVFQRLRKIDRLADFELGAERVQEVLDTFLDTADRAILAAGYYCRQRRVAGRPGVEMTLKALDGGVDAVRRRQELNLRLPDIRPPAAWPAGPLRDRLQAWIGTQPLLPLFALHQVRHVRPLLREGQPVAEFSLDRVRLSTGRHRETIRELEVELLPGGNAADLMRVVTALQAAWPLAPQRRSKFERGLALVEKGAGHLLTADERATCLELAQRKDLHGRRARALLALDSGATQEEAGRQAAMSERRVRYWQAAFRRKRMLVFPRRVLGPSSAAPAPPADKRQAPAPAKAGAGAFSETPDREADQPQAERLAATPEDIAQLAHLAAELSPDDTMALAARKVLARHWDRLLEHEPGVRLGQDMEEVHDMRVATRRLRAALRVFGDHLDAELVRALARDLRRLGRLLGTVRDMDVFREKAQRYLDGRPAEERASLDPLFAVWQTHYDQARRELLAYLDGERFARLKDNLVAFLQYTPGTPMPPSGGQPRPNRLRQLVPVALYQALAVVRAYAEWLAGPDVPLARYHQLRIDSKALRYTLEFFRDVLGPETAVLIERVKALQDHLGDLQDAVVACGLLRDFLTWGTWGRPAGDAPRPTAPILAPGVATYLAHRQVEIQQLVAAFPPIWEQVRGPEFARLLGASVTGLLE